MDAGTFFVGMVVRSIDLVSPAHILGLQEWRSKVEYESSTSVFTTTELFFWGGVQFRARLEGSIFQTPSGGITKALKPKNWSSF